MSFQVQGIDHVEVLVRDIDAAIHWYAEVLGLKEVCRWDPEPVMIGAGGTNLALFKADVSGSNRAPHGARALRWRRVAWRTDRAGFARAQQHLRQLGIPFRGPVDHDTSWSLYFQDTDGHPLEITTLV